MEYVFLFIFLFSLLGLAAGLLKPNFLKRVVGRDLSRRQNLLIYSALIFFSFVGVGVTAPEIDTPPSPVTQFNESSTNDEINVEQGGDSEGSIEQVGAHEPTPASAQAGELYQVTRVVDGDTIEVRINNETKVVRYIGINTPETVHPSKPVECFGREASDKNKALVAGKRVRLIQDVSDTDRYGRLLRYVYVGEVFVNEELVRQGYANASTYPPDVAMSERFRQAEEEARLNQRGLWGSACSGREATAAPAPVPVTTSAPAVGQCTIKGNINSEGEKIYHAPGCQSYSKTVIDESKGERWFCSESEAVEAGWRKALNC